MTYEKKCKLAVYNLKIALKEAERTIEAQNRIIAQLMRSDKLKVAHSTIRMIDENIEANIPDFTVRTGSR